MHRDPVESGSFLAAILGAAFLCLVISACAADPARDAPAPPADAPAVSSSASEVAPAPSSSPSEEAPAPSSSPDAQGSETPSPQQGTQEQGTPPAKPTLKEQFQKAAAEEGIVLPEQAPPQEPVAEAPAPQPTQAPAPAPDDWVHGSLGVRYRSRSGGDDHDNDLGAVLALDVANPNAPWISGHLQARADADLDGDTDVFGEPSDTWDSSVTSKLYLAYADISLDADPAQSPGTLRVGRQSDPRLPEVLRLDGVAYVTKPMGKDEVELGAYGGIPVHLYESSSEGDRAYGTFAEAKPWTGGRARVDWMHLDDELVLGDQRDDLLALGLWQDVAKDLRFEGTYSHLEGDPRDLRLRGFYSNPESETNVRLSFYQLLETQSLNATELDPFFQQLLEYFPYRQTTMNVSQALGERTLLDVGIDVRRLNDQGDVGEFNREWERYYATATFSDLLAEGFALSVTVDRWNDDDRDTSSFGADLSWDPDKRWKASIGTYYSLYKYEFLEFDERDDVRTYYVRAGYDVSADVDLDLLYEFEDDDQDTYNTLRVGTVWRF
jgi:hypothetical protein